jgi:hypothetical protein
MTRSDYEERQEARRQRLLDRAAKAQADAERAEGSASRLASFIPLGQPILVGHHSEKRHRRDIERIQRGLEKAHEARGLARELERRAEAVGTAGVSSDDPEAVAKLRAKLDDLEQEQERRKAVNAAWRKAGKPPPNADAEVWCRVGEAAGLAEDALRNVRLEMARVWGWQPNTPPFPAYAISNAGAEVRRVKARIAELERSTSATHREVDHGVCRVIEDPVDNRVRLVFATKPNEGVRGLLKSFGFRWSPQASAWQRHLNDAGRAAARVVVERLREEVPDGE